MIISYQSLLVQHKLSDVPGRCALISLTQVTSLDSYNMTRTLMSEYLNMHNSLLIFTLLKIISLDNNGNTNLIRNRIYHNKQSSCIGTTIVSSHRIVLMIMEVIVTI